MHIKFLAHGTGDPHSAVSYLLASDDHAGRPRAKVSVLCGNPALVAEVVAGLRTVHRYTSGLISWAREDEPTNAEIEAVVNDFERTAFAGLDAQQYSWCVVQHNDNDGGKHVHVFVARTELQSGKALNIAPPGWQKTFDQLRDYWNHTKGWARPDDPLRARPLQPGRSRLSEAAAMRQNSALSHVAKNLGIHVTDLTDALAVEPDPKRMITDWLLDQIYDCTINSRVDLIKALEALGTLNRVGNDYVSIRLEGYPRPLRLKGSIYADDFDAAAIRERVTQPRDLTLTRGQPDLPAAQLARRELDAAIERRAIYNRKHFPAQSPMAPSPSPSLSKDQEDSPQMMTDEARHDRTRDAVAHRVEHALRAARNSVRRFVEACATAVRSSELFSRAGRLAQRASASALGACDSAERASTEAQRAIHAAHLTDRQELHGPDEQAKRAYIAVTTKS